MDITDHKSNVEDLTKRLKARFNYSIIHYTISPKNEQNTTFAV